ncbi:MAG: hypothetical protein ACI4MC_06925, partial [Candidatus Coproplasma sp.]
IIMEEQRKLEYYLFYDPNITNKTVRLFAYGDFYEFFRQYDNESGQWIISKVSFSEMIHDYRYREISEEEAKEITGGNLPVDDYKKYCEFLSDRK